MCVSAVFLRCPFSKTSIFLSSVVSSFVRVSNFRLYVRHSPCCDRRLQEQRLSEKQSHTSEHCVFEEDYISTFVTTTTNWLKRSLCVPPVLRWLTEPQDQLNSSNPCSSRSGPACSHGCAGWAPLTGSRSCGGRCCLSAGTAGRAEARLGCSSWKERRPAGNVHPRYSGYDWRDKWREMAKHTKCQAWLLAQCTLNFGENGAAPPLQESPCHLSVDSFHFTYSSLDQPFSTCFMSNIHIHCGHFSSKVKARSIFNKLPVCPHIILLHCLLLHLSSDKLFDLFKCEVCLSVIHLHLLWLLLSFSCGCHQCCVLLQLVPPLIHTSHNLLIPALWFTHSLTSLVVKSRYLLLTHWTSNQSLKLLFPQQRNSICRRSMVSFWKQRPGTSVSL